MYVYLHLHVRVHPVIVRVGTRIYMCIYAYILSNMRAFTCTYICIYAYVHLRVVRL